MTSARKIAANRANAKASTGPRTGRGKSKAAQNARRHGLSLSVSGDPTHVAQVEKFTGKIVGKGTDPEILESARRIAEAGVELARIRQVRHELFAAHFSAGEIDTGTSGFALKLSGLTKQLMLIDRYERRALSRRKFAIRKLDAATLQGTK